MVLCELRLTVLGKALFAVVALLGLLLIGATIAADIAHGDEHAEQIAAVDLLIAGGALAVVVVVDHVLQLVWRGVTFAARAARRG